MESLWCWYHTRGYPVANLLQQDMIDQSFADREIDIVVRPLICFNNICALANPSQDTKLFKQGLGYPVYRALQ
jgi:hypothetical protein